MKQWLIVLLEQELKLYTVHVLSYIGGRQCLKLLSPPGKKKNGKKKLGFSVKYVCIFCFSVLWVFIVKNIFMKLLCASLSFVWSCLLVLKAQTMT